LINYKIEELEKSNISLKRVQNFLFKLIKIEYGLDYVPKYHKDIKFLKKYYMDPKRNNFFLAININTNEIIGTIGIREYDREYETFENNYSKKSTASFYRVFVDEKYRRNGIASSLVKKAEEFCYKECYNEIYLHTQKIVNGAPFFWSILSFKVVFDAHDELGTLHMNKKIHRSPLKLYDVSLASLNAK